MLTSKQYLKVKSFIVNANNCLNEIFPPFNPLHKELLSGFRLVDNFPDHFSFHTIDYRDKESKEVYLHKLDKITEDTLSNPKIVIVVSDISIKNNIATFISYIWLSSNMTIKTIHYTVNIISIEAEIFAIRYSINQAV